MKKILSLLALTALTIGLLGSCKKEDPKVSVTGISLDKPELTITVGDPDVKLVATVAPDNATDKSVNWSSDKTDIATVDQEGNVHAVTAGTAIITVTTTDGGKTATCAVKVKATLPANALPGEFSVSTTKKVLFSKGNLVATIDATGAPTAWKFATNQYDYIGEGGANKTNGEVAGDVDLFVWSTASTTYGISTSTSSGGYSGDFVDWGKAYCEKNNITPDNTWRTLSKDEWTYLFNTRIVNGGTGEGKSYQRATINSDATSVYGMILYPDGYNLQTAATSYTSTEWKSLENAGCVFLPAAGFHLGTFVHHFGDTGIYWSSTAYDSDFAYCVYFLSADVIPDNFDYRYYGFSVRLITECQ